MKCFNLELPCELEGQEYTEKVEALADSVTDDMELVKKNKEEKDKMTVKERASKAKVLLLSTMVKTKTEYREVSCYTRKNYIDKIWETVREDTHEIVEEETRLMSEEDLQEEMFDSEIDVK